MLEFTTDDANCPIDRYLVQDLVTGITADTACSGMILNGPACRSAIIDQTILGVYTIKFKVRAKGGNEVDSSPITLSIVCSDAVVLTSPLASLTTIEFKKGESPSDYVIGIFTTNEAGCPIESYEVITLIAGITQTLCPGTPNELVCGRTLTVDTSVVKIYSQIKYIARSEGGGSEQSPRIMFKITCPSNIVITQPASFVDSVSYMLGSGT